MKTEQLNGRKEKKYGIVRRKYFSFLWRIYYATKNHGNFNWAQEANGFEFEDKDTGKVSRGIDTHVLSWLMELGLVGSLGQGNYYWANTDLEPQDTDMNNLYKLKNSGGRKSKKELPKDILPIKEKPVQDHSRRRGRRARHVNNTLDNRLTDQEFSEAVEKIKNYVDEDGNTYEITKVVEKVTVSVERYKL